MCSTKFLLVAPGSVICHCLANQYALELGWNCPIHNSCPTPLDACSVWIWFYFLNKPHSIVKVSSFCKHGDSWMPSKVCYLESFVSLKAYLQFQVASADRTLSWHASSSISLTSRVGSGTPAYTPCRSTWLWYLSCNVIRWLVIDKPSERRTSGELLRLNS